MDIILRKKELRKRIRAAERSLSAEFRRSSDAAVTRNLLSLEEYRKARTVFLFAGCGYEIDTKEMILDALKNGKRVTLPLCTGPGIMEARQIRSLSELEPGAYGIPEPGPACPAVPFSEIDFTLVPCYSCDRNGRRLGKGGGYYDRFLEKYTGDTAIIVRECLMNYDIPMEGHDATVLPIVTDHNIYR